MLSVILEKLKWDEEADPEDIDEDDKEAFEELRKVRNFSFNRGGSHYLGQDLRTFMDAALVIDQSLVSDALSSLALTTLQAYRSGAPVKWHDAELAVYVVFIFGGINKSKFDSQVTRRLV